MLDYTISAEELGKPAGADLELGLATAPLLFAWKTSSELGSLVGRKFAGEGDVTRVRTFQDIRYANANGNRLEN
jgi:hexaprenyl-diphosphate synthase